MTKVSQEQINEIVPQTKHTRFISILLYIITKSNTTGIICKRKITWLRVHGEFYLLCWNATHVENIFSPKLQYCLSIFKCNSGKTNNKFVASNNFYPVLRVRRVKGKESDELSYIYGPGHSLWSANQLPARQGGG